MFENIVQSLYGLVIGLSVVFLSLAFFSAMIVVLKYGDSFISKAYNRIKYKEQVPSPVSVTNEIEDEELIAVISAAAMQVIQKKIKIKKIHFSNEPVETSYATTGRLTILASHNINVR